MLNATGTQDLNQMGGLMRFMPLTAVTALIASFSISGVPLSNSFASKWSIYVAAIQGAGLARYLPACVVIAILTSALTLATFIKFFGVSFLSRTSATVKTRAENGRLEVPWMMQVPQVLLAFCCVLLGLVPALGFRLLQHLLAASRNGLGSLLADRTMALHSGWKGVATESSAAFAPLVLAAVLGALFLLAYGFSRLGQAPRRKAVPWLCGYALEADCNRYVAHNFYGEIKRYSGWVGGTPAGRTGKPAAMEELP